jgi:hypothetical protein
MNARRQLTHCWSSFEPPKMLKKKKCMIYPFPIPPDKKETVACNKVHASLAVTSKSELEPCSKTQKNRKRPTKTKKIEGNKNLQQKFTNKSQKSQASQAACSSSSSSQEPQTFLPASAMASVCFRTCHVRRFLDDISTSAAYYGKKEKSCSNLEQLKRETNGEEDWKGRYKQY